MKVNKFILNFDYILFFSAILLTVMGILFIFSANLTKSEDIKTEYLKQIFFLVVSLVIFFTIVVLPTRSLQNVALFFYILCFVILFITLLFPEVKGQRRMNIGGFSLQISEFMKVAMIMLLSLFYGRKSKEEIRYLSVYIKGAALAISPVLVIMLQPDLGTSLVFFPIFLVISYLAGIKKRYIFYTILLIIFIAFIPVVTTMNRLFYNNENNIISLLENIKYLILLLLAIALTLVIAVLAYFDVIKGISQKFKIFFYWYIFFCSVVLIGLSLSYPANKFLKPYQKDRLLIFFNPYVDEKGKGYHIIQSMTTIGNGGLFGKGWMKGEQVQKFFLPEQATDFIYPVIAEESGFLGSALILLFFSLIFYRGLKAASSARDYWGVYTVAGILTLYLFHIIENIGMCVGIMPITGIPLPFLSYGGSFLMSCYLGLGIIMNINLNKYQY